MAQRQFKDRSSSPRGQGGYDAEEDLPYLHKGKGRSEEHQDALDRADAGLDDIDSVLAEQEAMKDGGHGGGSKAATAEAEALGKATGAGGWTDNTTEEDEDTQPKGILRGWKRKAAAGGAAALGGGMIFGILSLSSGPLQFLHFAELLQGFHFSSSESFTDGRASQLIRYARTYNCTECRNLGYFGDKIAKHYLARLREAGVEFHHQRGRIRSITIDENDNPRIRQAIDQLDELGIEHSVEVGEDGIRRRTYTFLGEDGFENASLRRQAISVTTDVLGDSGVSNSMVARLLKRRGGVDLHPLKNITRAADEAFFEWAAGVRRAAADYIKEGRRGGASTSVRTDPDASGEAPTPEEQANATGSADEANDIEHRARTNGPTTEGPRLRTRLARGGLVVGGFAALACGLNDLGDEVAAIQTSNIVRPLIRNGMQVVSVAAQIRFGQDFNGDELGALAQSLYNDVDKTSWIQAESIQAELGHPNSGIPMDESAIPGTEKPAFFQSLQEVLDRIPGSAGVCDAVTSSFGSFFLQAADFAFGPFSAALSTGTSEILTRAFMDDFLRWVTGDQINALVEGAQYGSYANTGTFLANNDRMSSLGGRELTNDEVVALKQEQAEADRYEIKKKSLFARLLDLKEPKSLASMALFENRSLASSQSFASGASKAPITVFGSVFNNLASLFTPRASAISVPYDYGVPPIGYSLGELASDIAKEDPYQNAIAVEGPDGSNLERLNDEYGDCFSTKIDPNTGEIKTSEVTQYIGRNREKCDNTNNTELLRYRLYLGDMTIAQGLTCYSGEDEATCANLGFENEADDAAVSQLPDGVVTAEDIVDLQPWMSAGAGCHVSIADRLRQMFQAADADGVHLTGSCWRSTESQIELRREHCGTSHYDIYERPSRECDPPTAIPGRSNHERGLAIDFDDCHAGSACFTWLSAHAAEYGMFNLPEENWHWSVDGS